MNFIFQPWQLLHLILAGWVNHQQQQINDYLRTENQVLREKLGQRRILLDDDQRRRLAVKGKVLGRKLLAQIGTIFTPDTILRWHRLLVARKWDYSDRRRKKPGRPALSQEIRDLVVRIAKENPTWGYDRIQGALANVGQEISETSVANILKEHGIEPAPRRRRQTTWKTFLKAHWDVLAAVDFTTVDEGEVTGIIPLAMLGLGVLLAFPASGYLVARASGADSVLEAALSTGLAIVGTLVMLGLAAPVAVVFALAFAPIAFGLACAGAWVGIGGTPG